MECTEDWKRKRDVAQSVVAQNDEAQTVEAQNGEAQTVEAQHDEAVKPKQMKPKVSGVGCRSRE